MTTAITDLVDSSSTPAAGPPERRAQHIKEQAASAAALIDLVGFPRTLIETLPAAIYLTDAEGRLSFYNEAAVELWGCRPELRTARFCGSWKLYRADGTPMAHDECPMAIALKEGRAIRGVEAIAERPDGSRVPFLPFPTPLFDATGMLVGAVNMLIDISERKRFEESLSRRRDEQAALYEFTDRLFRAAAPSEIFDAALEAIERALGCNRASILLFDQAGVMRFVASRGLSENYRKAVEGHSPWPRDALDPQPISIWNIELADLPEALKATIRAENIAALAFIPVIANGKLAGKFMTYYSEPHNFQKSEVQLALSLARQLGFSIEKSQAEADGRLYGSIVESSADAIVSKDTDGIVTSWNKGAECIFGYTAAEMIGRPILTLIPLALHDEEVHILDRIRRGETVSTYDTVRRRKDGSLVHVSLTVSPVRNAAGRVIGASKIARDITERRLTAERQELLAREVHHRTKNLFAVVQSVVGRSFAGKETVQEAKEAAMNRLQSLAQTHSLLIDHEWEGAELAEVVRTEMRPYLERVTIQGPSIELSAKAAQNFGMALHELATNAAKYGALSDASGQVHIAWSLTRTRLAGGFSFLWQERGGPPVEPPKRKGFGSAVLEQVMAEYVVEPPQIEFAPEGLRYALDGKLEAVISRKTKDI